MVLSNDLYFDKGNLIIGISYLVLEQDPQCLDLNAINVQLQASFNADLVSLLCTANYEYYFYIDMKPTKYFYSLELIGEVDSEENQFRVWTQTAILNAWSKNYTGMTLFEIKCRAIFCFCIISAFIFKEFSDISMPMLSNKFQSRIGSLGTATTRIFYILYVDGQQALSNYIPAPANNNIELEFNILGSDIRVYQYGDSIAKSLLSSLYIQMHPLKASIRDTLEKQIKLGLHISPQNSGNHQINVLYYELYYGQNKQAYVSRVYYSVISTFILIYT